MSRLREPHNTPNIVIVHIYVHVFNLVDGKEVKGAASAPTAKTCDTPVGGELCIYII